MSNVIGSNSLNSNPYLIANQTGIRSKEIQSSPDINQESAQKLNPENLNKHLTETKDFYTKDAKNFTEVKSDTVEKQNSTESQNTLNSAPETPDPSQIKRKYKNSTLIPIGVRDTSTGEVKIKYYEKPSLLERVKENIKNDVEKVTTSVVNDAKIFGGIGWGISMMRLGILGPVVGVPAAILGGTTGAIFGLLSAPFNGRGI